MSPRSMNDILTDDHGNPDAEAEENGSVACSRSRRPLLQRCRLGLPRRFWRWLQRHGGHNQLAVRGCVSLLQAVLSLLVFLLVASFPQMAMTCACQAAASATLFLQWRQLLNGTSLLLQFAFPSRGVTAARGNEQLLYRSWVQASGIPIQLSRGVLKLLILEDSMFERSKVEVAANFLRCGLVMVYTWSLWDQWRATGTGEGADSPGGAVEERGAQESADGRAEELATRTLSDAPRVASRDINEFAESTP